MTVDLMLLHTCDRHVSYFNALRDALAPTARLEHVLRPDWKARALSEGVTWPLRREMDTFIRCADAPVLCCSTLLGDAAEAAGGWRLDRPMMQAAAEAQAPVLLVASDEERAAHSLALIEETKAGEGNDHAVIPLVLDKFRPLYDGGDAPGFHAAIAAAVIEAICARPDLRQVVLTDVCMAPVVHLLDGAGVTLLSAPESGLRAALSPFISPQARASLGDPMTT